MSEKVPIIPESGFHRFIHLDLGKNPWIASGIIFVIALLLRGYPVSFGLPYLHYWDEPSYLKLTLQMLRTGDFDHHWYHLPPFFFYQQVLVQTVHYLTEVKNGNLHYPNDIKINEIERDIDPSLVRWSRRYTAILGALSCIFLYFILKDLFHFKIAFLSGLILAVMQGHIEHSMVITADVPLGFLVLVTLWLILRPEAGTTAWSSLCLGIFSGLGIATKYNGAAIALVPFIRFYVKKQLNPFLWIAVLLGIVMGFTIGYPHWLHRFPDVISGLAEELFHYNAQFEIEGISHQYGWVYLQYLFLTGMGAILSLFAAVGIYSWFQIPWRKEYAVFLSFPILYLLLLLKQPANYYRNLIPLFPWLACFSAFGIQAAYHWLDRTIQGCLKNVILLLTGILLTIGVMYPTLSWIHKVRTTPETRIKLADWLSENTVKDDVIGIPRDLHILPNEQKRIHRSLIILETSDLQDQTLMGLNLLACGAKPGYLKALTLMKQKGRLDEWRKLEVEKAEKIQAYIRQLHPKIQILSPEVYLPHSTFSEFCEGYWILEGFSVNPSLIVADIKANPGLHLLPPTGDSFKVESWEWKAPQLNQTLEDHPLSIGNVSYPFGIGAHAGARLVFPVPENAKRFLVDIGIAGDLYDRTLPSITATVKFAEDRIYESGVIKKDSSIWRVDAPIAGSREIRIIIGDAGDGLSADHTVLGYCAFVTAQEEVNNR